MFNLGGGELLVIALIALIVLGPERLPDAARTVGKVMGEIRRLSTGFQEEVRTAFTEPEIPATTKPQPNSSPLSAEVAELDEGVIDATSTDVTERATAPGEPGAEPAEVSPEVAAALGEVLAGPGAEQVSDGNEQVHDGTATGPDEPGTEHRAAS